VTLNSYKCNNHSSHYIKDGTLRCHDCDEATTEELYLDLMKRCQITQIEFLDPKMHIEDLAKRLVELGWRKA
jgi:hypothetical protein